MKGKRSGIIGALATTWAKGTEARALGLMSQLASERGFKVLGWQVQGQHDSLDGTIDDCIGWNIDGLVFFAYKYDAIWPEVARAVARVPRFVSVLGNLDVPGGTSVEIDAADAVRQCVEYCFKKGRRRVVQLLEGRTSQIDARRYEAFQEAHREFYGVPDEDQVCFATEGWRIDEYDKFHELARELVLVRKADAVLAESDFSGPGLIRAWSKLGRRTGQDVFLIGWGGERLGEATDPALSTVDFNFPEILATALDLLSGMIEKPDEPRPASVFVKPKLILRESA